MKDSILWIIDGYRYWDKTNGNSYYLTRVTHTRTGKSLFFDECEGNMRSHINEADRARGIDPYARRIHTAPLQDIPYREWRAKLNNPYHAPVSQYSRRSTGHRTNRSVKVINITTQLLNKLRSKKA